MYADLCWAACCQMILLYNHTPVQGLPDILAQVIGQSCRLNPDSCDETCWPTDAYQQLQYNCSQVNYAFDVPSLTSEIVTNQRPVQALLQWNPDSSHVVVLSGLFYDTDGTPLLAVLDSLNGKGVYTYEYILEAYGTSGWWNYTFYKITPTKKQNGQANPAP